MTYAEKLKDPRWQRKRLAIFNRDAFTCCDCRSDKKTLEIHHCYYGKGMPWDTADHFLLTLCSDCHKRRQSAEDELRMRFSSMNSGSSIHQVEKVLAILQKAQRDNKLISIKAVKR